jgi:hypothetical protein
MAIPPKAPAEVFPKREAEVASRSTHKRINFQTVIKPPQKAALIKHINLNHPDTQQAAAPAPSSTTQTIN